MTFGAIDTLFRGIQDTKKKFEKSKMPVDFDKNGDSNASSKTEDNDTKTEDGDLEVPPTAVVDTAAL